MGLPTGIVGNKELEPLPVRSTRVVPHKGRELTISDPPFGSGYFDDNLWNMKKSYSNPKTGESISFRESTTSESISSAVYNFWDTVKTRITEVGGGLQLGYILKTQEGVFANPPKNSDGHPITDEKILKSLLNGTQKIRGIWIYEGKDAKDFGFAPYETFKTEEQDSDTFSEGGLARILEHTTEKIATSLRRITTPNNYENGVLLGKLEKVKEPTLRIALLHSSRSSVYIMFDDVISLTAENSGDVYEGFAFGILG